MAYALAKADGHLQTEELDTLKDLLAKEPHGEIAIYVLNLQDTHGMKVQDAYQFALRRFQENRRDLDESTKKKFVRILERVAEAYEGTTRKESELLRQCRRDLRKL